MPKYLPDPVLGPVVLCKSAHGTSCPESNQGTHDTVIYFTAFGFSIIVPDGIIMRFSNSYICSISLKQPDNHCFFIFRLIIIYNSEINRGCALPSRYYNL